MVSAPLFSFFFFFFPLMLINSRVLMTETKDDGFVSVWYFVVFYLGQQFFFFFFGQMYFNGRKDSFPVDFSQKKEKKCRQNYFFCALGCVSPIDPLFVITGMHVWPAF